MVDVLGGLCRLLERRILFRHSCRLGPILLAPQGLASFFFIESKVKRNKLKSLFCWCVYTSSYWLWINNLARDNVSKFWCTETRFLRTVLVPRLVHVPDGRLDSDLQEVCHPSLHEASGFHRRIHQQGKEPRGRGLRERLIYCPNAKLCTSVLVYRLQTLQRLKRISLICQTV